MGLKSAWAYNNGKRTMKYAIESLKDEPTGWIERGGTYLYAERNKETGKLMVKTYSNKKQADVMVQKQKDLGFDAFRSFQWPFTVCCCALTEVKCMVSWLPSNNATQFTNSKND